MASTGRRPSDQGPREERVRSRGPRAQEESRSGKHHRNGTDGRRASTSVSELPATDRPHQHGNQGRLAPREEGTARDMERNHGFVNKK
eukprot:530656-Heterocapsa_arctica.AAC.1